MKQVPLIAVLNPVALSLVLAVLACTAPVRVAALEAHYSSTSSRISVDGFSLTVVRMEHEYANPVSAVPSRTQTFSSTAVLALEDLRPLEHTIRTSGFLQLPSSCGAPENERHYPYTIRVRIDGKVHEVTYRSNPSFPGCPGAFHDVERSLQALASRGIQK